MLFSIITIGTGSSYAQQKKVTGKVASAAGEPLVGVSVKVKGTNTGASTDADGNYALSVPANSTTLVFTYIGFTTKEEVIGDRSTVNVTLSEDDTQLEEVVVTGYGSQKRGSITGSVATVTSADLDRVKGGSTVSSTLAGKLPGVSFRMPDGRPGASANIQIRNLGNPLYVIDGIQQDAGQFNNLAPNDIESITVLKDASAAIYGVRAANGVVVVTTKKGKQGDRNTVNVDAYAGAQNWFRFADVLDNSYDYMRYRAEAEINRSGSTAITPAELERYRAGTEPGYQSFNWRDFVIDPNAPQTSININATGGSDKVNYYVSATRYDQNSTMGREYLFNRTNIQSNISAQISSRLRVGVQINGRIETRENPGVPGGDDYFLARFSILRNTPLERPYANDNPAYLNDIKHNESNYAYLNYDIAGKLKSDWRVLQSNFTADYQIPGIKGLTARGTYSYYLADHLLNNHEYTYEAYTYRPETDTYDVTGGSTNPWREREQIKQINQTYQAQLNYNNTFGRHNVAGTLVAERISQNRLRNWIHSVPSSNALPLIYFNTADQYQDSNDLETRVGYIGRVNYDFANKYYLEVSARRDASYLFAPDKRVGYFPSASIGWRITEEGFMKKLLGDESFLNDFKLRASYGILGDDRNLLGNGPIVTPFAYIPGYNYNQNGISILDGRAIVVSRDKGVAFDNITWLKSKILDIGADFTLLDNKLTGSFDYFRRERDGLLAPRIDRLVPSEIGYALPEENLNSDAQFGQEAALNYNSRIGQLSYNIGINGSYSRSKSLDVYNPTFFNSWDQYRFSQVNRFTKTNWGREVIGQFQSVEEINNHPINNDGENNARMLPGDLIYKDQNGDGLINGFDDRPIGFGINTLPNINYGFSIGLGFKAFDFSADFSGGTGYTWYQNFETKWAFQNDGNLNRIFEDRWHRQDPYDPNSPWVAGKYPANRFNDASHPNYNNSNDFWAHNVWALRARTIQIGYTLPKKLLDKVNIQRARVYINGYNLFSIDNLDEFSVDPEVQDENGLQFPQSRIVNAGINISL